MRMAGNPAQSCGISAADSQAMPDYLTTKELADLLRIKERKVYDLAAAGEVPCAKVTGKLLFPRRDVEVWLAEARSGPRASGVRPNVFLGSHDPLLDWALRESRCGLATYFDGSLDGLDRFAAGEGVATGLHVRDAAGGWNTGAVAALCGGLNAVLIGFATRRRGLVTAADAGIADLDDLAGCTVVQRQKESGAEPLFARMLAEAGVDTDAIRRTPPARSESDAALAILRGDADAAFGLEALAAQYGLSFRPLIEEHFDLLVDRRAFFEPPLQAFMAFCRTEALAEGASRMAGYDIGEFGSIRWNGD